LGLALAHIFIINTKLLKKKVFWPSTQMSPDKIADYKAQYLQEGEVAYGQLANSFNTDYTNEINQEKQLCQTGEDSNVTVDNFDVNSLFGCWNHHSFILDKGAWVQDYINWKMSLISPSNSYDNGNQ